MIANIEPIELTALRESPTNPRTSASPEKIAEMADTILTHGILQPLTVRPWRGEAGTYEIVFGHRRYLAAQAALRKARALEDEGMEARSAELVTVPAMVRDLTDAQVVEMQVIENLQREDVSARDEAEGYERLLELKDGEGKKLYTLESLAERIGKKKSYVSNRLRLRLAPESLWKAYESGLVGARQLELVGGIPHAKTREEAAQKILKPDYSDSPMTVKETEELIREHYRVSLRACGFELDDAELVREEYKAGLRFGGACTTCPHRTGNDPELQEQLANTRGGGKGGGSKGVDPNLCCNPACFQAKQAVVWRRQKAAVENDGRKVLDVDATSSMFSNYGDRELNWGSPYVDLGGRPQYRETGQHDTADLPTWGELLQDTDAMKLSTVARHPHTKRLHYLLEWEKAVELASENGHSKIFANRPKAEKPKSSRREAGSSEADRRKGDRSVAVFRMVQRLAPQRVAAEAGGRLSDEAGLAIAEIAFRLALIDETDMVLEFAGVELEENKGGMESELWDLARAKMPPGEWLEWTVAFLLIASYGIDWVYNVSQLRNGAPGRLLQGLGLDLDAIEAEAEKAVDAAQRRELESELEAIETKRLKLKPRDKAGRAELDKRERELRKELGLPEVGTEKSEGGSEEGSGCVECGKPGLVVDEEGRRLCNECGLAALDARSAAVAAKLEAKKKGKSKSSGKAAAKAKAPKKAKKAKK